MILGNRAVDFVDMLVYLCEYYGNKYRKKMICPKIMKGYERGQFIMIIHLTF